MGLNLIDLTNGQRCPAGSYRRGSPALKGNLCGCCYLITCLIRSEKGGGGMCGPQDIGGLPARLAMSLIGGDGPTLRTMHLPGPCYPRKKAGGGGLLPPPRTSVVSVFSKRYEPGPQGCDISTFLRWIVTSEPGANPVPMGGP